jgi:hypothetical protein
LIGFLKTLRGWMDSSPKIRPTLFFMGLAAFVASQSTAEGTLAHQIAEKFLHALVAIGLLSPGAPSPNADPPGKEQ